jgi:hypothetical protein
MSSAAYAQDNVADRQPVDDEGRYPLEDLHGFTSAPFLFWGLPINDPGTPNPAPILAYNLDNYFAAVERYPDLDSCLGEGAVGQTDVNIDAFGWNHFTSLQDVEVCLFFVAKFIHDSTALTRWLERQGGGAMITYDVPYSSFRFYAGEGDGIGIGSAWMREPGVIPFSPDTPLDQLGRSARSFGVDFILTLQGDPKSTNANFSFK